MPYSTRQHSPVGTNEDPFLALGANLRPLQPLRRTGGYCRHPVLVITLLLVYRGSNQRTFLPISAVCLRDPPWCVYAGGGGKQRTSKAVAALPHQQQLHHKQRPTTTHTYSCPRTTSPTPREYGIKHLGIQIENMRDNHGS